MVIEGKEVEGRWTCAKQGNGDRKRLCVGGGHTMQCADGVLLSCALETCVVF